MKISFFFILILPVLAFAQSELPSLLKQLNTINTAPVKCSPADFQKCAKALCGPVQDHVKLSNGSLNETEVYNEEKYGNTEKIKARLRKVLERNQKKNEEVIKTARINIPKSIAGELEESWDPSDWQEEALKVFEPHVKMVFEKDNLLVTANPPSGSSEEFKAALNHFALKAKNFYLRYPHYLMAREVVSENEFFKLDEKSYDVNYATGDLCKEAVCRSEIVSTFKASVMKKLDEFEAINRDPANLEDATIRCLSNHMYYGKTMDKVEEFNKLLPSVKKNFIEKGMDGFSEHSRKKFQEYLDKDLAFDFGVESPLDLLKKSERSARGISEETLFNQLKDRSEFSLYPFADVHSCKSQMDVNIVDAYIQDVPENTISHLYALVDKNKKDTISLSQKTCRFHKAGEGVVSHEIGHALSFQFKGKKLSESSYTEYMKTRNCATKSHPEFKAAYQARHEGDGNFTEEDTADLLSYKSNADQETVGLCFLLLNNGDKYSHMNGSEFQNVDVDLVKNGSHTLSFVRVIREAIYKKKALPESCENVVMEYRQTYKDQQSCL